MNKKGILFTFMALLLLLSIIALNSIIREQQFASQKSMSEISALVRVNNKLNSILANIVELDEENRIFNQRILPFDYSIDSNTILIEQQLPLREISVRNYFDTINSYAIFVGDANYANVFDGIGVDINAARNVDWGGNSNQLNFIIEPQCLKYTVVDLNESVLAAGNCAEQFDIGNVLRYDLNIIVSGEFIEDYNSVQCDFFGFAGCPDMNFDGGSPLPYFELNFNDENCTHCLIEENLKTIKGHYSPLHDNNITISCIPDGGGVCYSEQIDINVSEGIKVLHNGNRIGFIIGTTFKNAVEHFEFEDLNVLVRNSTFNVRGRRIG